MPGQVLMVLLIPVMARCSDPLLRCCVECLVGAWSRRNLIGDVPPRRPRAWSGAMQDRPDVTGSGTGDLDTRIVVLRRE
jgi:hypothetical protein